MNNINVLACFEDWHLSSHLAKLSSIYSYNLTFCEERVEMIDLNVQNIIIIDIDIIAENIVKNIFKFSNEDLIFIIGFADEIDVNKMKSLKGMGYDVILNRKKLLNSLESILNKVVNGP